MIGSCCNNPQFNMKSDLNITETKATPRGGIEPNRVILTGRKCTMAAQRQTRG